MFFYQKSGPGLWEVGRLSKDGEWEPESEWNTSEEAAERTHWLNGGIRPETDDDEASSPVGRQ